MAEEGNLKQIIDPKLNIDQHDEMLVSTIRVALWCIQDDMNLRPPMTKVVQMLEGSCPVPEPPGSSQLSCRAYADYIKWTSSKASSSSGLCESTSSDTEQNGVAFNEKKAMEKNVYREDDYNDDDDDDSPPDVAPAA
ncbi:hypothetical protein ACFE04_032018 [Oxalis oulophora]